MGMVTEAPTVLVLEQRREASLTEEQFWQLCQANRDLRIERDAQGSIIIMSPAGFESSDRNAEIVMQLRQWAKRDGRGTATDSSGGFELPSGSMRAPDAAWVRRDRLDALTPEERRRFPHLAPDFVIELRSETDPLDTLKRKMEEYRASGVALGWLIDPSTRRVWIYRAGEDGAEELADAVGLAGDPLLPGFTLDLTQVW
jgi:Uma2 family endonuclease